MELTFSITPYLLEQAIAGFIVIAMLVTLSIVVRRFIGE